MMEVKVGQWVRLMSNRFMKNEQEDFEDVVAVGFGDPIIKVANTPQELVQDKDLIQYTLTLNGNTWETLIMECDDFEEELYQLEEEFENVEITKILTPNPNGGYDLQYSKEDD